MSKRINTTITSSSFKSTARLIAAHAALLATLAIAAPAHAGLLGGAGGGGLGGNIGGSLGGSLNGSMSGLQRPDLSRAKDKLAEAKIATAEKAADKTADGKTQGDTALA
ncbi:MAG: hypothetical protein H7242_06015, partial [Microbacteriaceae bacterium]|nr:hypothetical protein [Burkholderiaceae bacterium]